MKTTKQKSKILETDGMTTVVVKPSIIQYENRKNKTSINGEGVERE